MTEKAAPCSLPTPDQQTSRSHPRCALSLVVRPYPKLKHWMNARGLNNRDFAAIVGCSYETVRLWVLPFGDLKRRVPSTEDIRRILEATFGEITAADHYPPELNGLSAAKLEAAE